MADLVITAANVVRTSGIKVEAIAGETITAGQAIYIDTSDSNEMKLSDCTTSATTAVVDGIALDGASDGQPIVYLKAGGVLNPGATVAVGKIYVLSASGAIAPVDDLTSADYTTIIGYATTTSSMTLTLDASGVQVP